MGNDFKNTQKKALPRGNQLFLAYIKNRSVEWKIAGGIVSPQKQLLFAFNLAFQLGFPNLLCLCAVKNAF